MMLQRRPHGRGQPQPVRQVCESRIEHRKADKPKSKVAAKEKNVAKIIAGVTSSHVPAIGAAIDNNRTGEPYWQRVFDGFERSKEWIAEPKPDV